MSERLNILGFEVDKVDAKSAVLKVEEFLQKSEQSYVVTLNSELIVKSAREFLKEGDSGLGEIIKGADLVVSDSVGVLLASKILARKFNEGKKLSERVAGVDLMLEICKLAIKKNLKCFLLGGALGSGELCKEKLKEVFGDELQIAGCYEKGDGSEWYDEEIINEINKVRPEIIFVAYGGGKQERWISRNKAKLGKAKVLMGVGGAFDFITGLKPINAGKLNFGKTRRAPKIFQKLWLEWLWRLILQPWRIRRVVDAILGMLFYTFCYWIRVSNKYRDNVMVGIYREVEAGREFLICNREDDHQHWQFVQGGLEKGDSWEEAAKREMKEEIGLINKNVFKIEKTLEKENKYLWPIGVALGRRGYQMKGQRQVLVLVKYWGDDKEDLDLENEWAEDLFYDYRWVSAKKVLEVIHPLRKKAVKLFLENEIWKKE
jgi:N-acetylglucosaminyldiphosphoundecaprenol N-acetyl-beta-D-mannosaminyltransferase